LFTKTGDCLQNSSVGKFGLAGRKIVHVATSVAKCWRQKRFRGDLLSQSTFHLVPFEHEKRSLENPQNHISMNTQNASCPRKIKDY